MIKHPHYHLLSCYTLPLPLKKTADGFIKQKKREEGSIFYLVKGGIFFRLFCLTNPALFIFSSNWSTVLVRDIRTTYYGIYSRLFYEKKQDVWSGKVLYCLFKSNCLQVRVPQGELMLLFIPQIRGTGGGATLELSHAHLRQILQVGGATKPRSP
jgi:hypothetical protein